MTTSYVSALPTDVEERLLAFLAAGKTGQVTLHIHEGNVLRWEIAEMGHVKGKER